jgi:two-component system phosphate regulon sensor histidine kinase PhoR
VWIEKIIIIPLTFIVSFLFLRFFIFRFIYDRIRLIYKSIHTKKEQGANKRKKFNANIDLINQVDHDVSIWAEEKSKQIASLQAMETYRKEFIGNVSHELKTPIFNIQGYALTLIDGGFKDKRIRGKYMKKIEKNINRMISIVNDLESISKLESGTLKLNIKHFNIEYLLNEIIESEEDYAKKKDISISIIKHYDRNKQVEADKHLISQVLINLVVNAINYGKKGGYVNIELFDMDQHILVEVTDNGKGISETDIARVFERFYRGDKSHSSKTSGTGLGLSIVKHIIEAHNQKINIRSTLDVGTTVAFTLKTT